MWGKSDYRHWGKMNRPTDNLSLSCPMALTTGPAQSATADMHSHITLFYSIVTDISLHVKWLLQVDGT